MPHHEIGKGALKMAIHLPKNNPRNVCWFAAGQLQIPFLLLGILAGCAPSNVPQPANKVGGEKVVSTTSEGSSELASDEWAVIYMEQQPVGTIHTEVRETTEAGRTLVQTQSTLSLIHI